ncbi:hypothetical protein FHS76_000950 [Ochrobactrum daejeonense]|uniref:Uncharacterized protein n=1 Tax=Brucella daejeonensis TaxID=659015 RepID=A0A7W9ELV6_9HYPH|nr:hypothetical protein [Brucella daejeonensis]MBB5701101.1 hypothetical protein [Brucella daejeonensis]
MEFGGIIFNAFALPMMQSANTFSVIEDVSAAEQDQTVVSQGGAGAKAASAFLIWPLPFLVKEGYARMS